MDSIKEKVSNLLGYFQNYINNFQIVEKHKNIFYFSKFTLEVNEFYEIYKFVHNLKENIFRSLIEQFKYCIKNLIVFENTNLTEKEKIMVIYSACFLNYYRKFCFNTDHTFEEYYDDSFMNLTKSYFKFDIINQQLFRVFCFYFFSKMQNEITALNYNKIKKLKNYYNYKKFFSEKNINVNNYTSNNMNVEEDEIDPDNKNKINSDEGGLLTYLISAKERMVDLVFEMRHKGYFPKICVNEINSMNIRLQKLSNMSTEELHNLGMFSEDYHIPNNIIYNNANINSFSNNIYNNKNKINENNNIENNININTINENYINNNSNFSTNEDKSNNTINTNASTSFSDNVIGGCINKTNEQQKFSNNFLNKNSAFKPNTNIFNIKSNNSENNNNMYSQRIINELTKNAVDDKTMGIIEAVAKKIDEKYLDNLINNSHKTVTIVKYFSCYIVEFTPELLQKIEPKNKDSLQNFCIKFIVLAKELYNTTMELFCTIYDLSYTNIDTFVDLSRNCGIQVKYAQGLYKMFKDYSILLLNEQNPFNDMKKILQILMDKQKFNWERTIKQKADEFTSFCKA